MTDALRASMIVWEWTCDECQLTAMGVFEEFAASGWVERHNMATNKVEKFCPRCTRGWKFIGRLLTEEERRAEEGVGQGQSDSGGHQTETG